jgi:hypothetical protein
MLFQNILSIIALAGFAAAAPHSNTPHGNSPHGDSLPKTLGNTNVCGNGNTPMCCGGPETSGLANNLLSCSSLAAVPSEFPIYCLNLLRWL